MKEITKAQAEAVRAKFPYVHINKTCKKKNNGSKRGKYYVEENRKVLAFLSKYKEG